MEVLPEKEPKHAETGHLGGRIIPHSTLKERTFRGCFSPGLGERMSLGNIVLPGVLAEEVGPKSLAQRKAAPIRLRLQSKASLPSRIAVIGNYLPRHCGIATFITDLCAAILTECGSARLLALPVNDTEEGYDYPDRVRRSLAQDDVKSYQETESTDGTSILSPHCYPIFGPGASYERHGDVDDVVFPCGYTMDADGDTLNIYYGAADCAIALARASVRSLLEWLDANGCCKRRQRAQDLCNSC